MSTDEWVGTNEAARLLGCSRQWVCQLIVAGKLKAMRPGHQWLVRRSAVQRHLKAHGPYHAEQTPDGM